MVLHSKLDPVYFGCDAKINANKLKTMLGHDCYGFLSEDNGDLNLIDGIIGSTDTVYQNSLDLENFALTSYLHSANDIWCSGGEVIAAFVNIGINSSASERECRLFINKIKDILVKESVKLVNAHTYHSEVNVITWTLVGREGAIKKPNQNEDIGLYLTDAIGSGYLSQNGCMKSEKVLMDRVNKQKLSQINFYKGTTDISGFGLAGSLVAIIDNFKCAIELDLGKLEVIDGLDNLVGKNGISCSAKQNIRAFGNYFVGSKLNPLQEQLVFGGEINGPILYLSKINQESDSTMLGKVIFSSQSKSFETGNIYV